MAFGRDGDTEDEAAAAYYGAELVAKAMVELENIRRLLTPKKG